MPILEGYTSLINIISHPFWGLTMKNPQTKKKFLMGNVINEILDIASIFGNSLENTEVTVPDPLSQKPEVMTKFLNGGSPKYLEFISKGITWW